MKSFCIALFLALVALVSAQSSNDSPFYITYPLSGTTLKAGESIDLAWNNGLDQTVKVVVIQGPNANTMSPTGITFNVQGDDGSYTWTVPKSLAPSGTYAFQFEYKGDNGATIGLTRIETHHLLNFLIESNSQYAYSGPVSVSGGTGTVGSVSATATSASASSAASSSAAPSSASSAAVSSSSAAVSSSSSSAASSSAASSSKTTASASATPSPSNAASGLTITSLALAVPALMMVALTA
ncbi:hypothetical protein [Absidia glauca]|uniref:Yeast cell wall synthesis Kre9/Knh1-like N-terminal domain-containing protein n=1 Tax=Absidia glauca TaxID=4829 RepID=A0A168P4R7_ABSGL|nr:hypothetical protein [Absidia glauca]